MAASLLWIFRIPDRGKSWPKYNSTLNDHCIYFITLMPGKYLKRKKKKFVLYSFNLKLGGFIVYIKCSELDLKHSLLFYIVGSLVACLFLFLSMAQFHVQFSLVCFGIFCDKVLQPPPSKCFWIASFCRCWKTLEAMSTCLRKLHDDVVQATLLPFAGTWIRWQCDFDSFNWWNASSCFSRSNWKCPLKQWR